MRLVGLLMATLAALPAAAAAQDTDTQLALSRSAPLPSAPDEIRFAEQLGSCAAGDVRNYAADVLRALPGSEQSLKALFWMVMETTCSGHNDFQFAPRSLRGPLAEYFLKRDFDTRTWSQKRRPQQVYVAPDNAKLEKLPDDVRANVILVEIGSCVAKSNPSAMTSLLNARVTSTEEDAAFSNISPTLAKCVPAGVQLKMSKFQLRGYLAEGTYRAAAAGMLAITVPAAHEVAQ